MQATIHAMNDAELSALLCGRLADQRDRDVVKGAFLFRDRPATLAQSTTLTVRQAAGAAA